MRRVAFLLILALAVLGIGRGQYLPGGGSSEVNVPTDTDDDGAPDSITCGDFDGDGTLEIFDDVDGCVRAMTDTGPKLVKVLPGNYTVPPVAECDEVTDVPCGLRLQTLQHSASVSSSWGGLISIRDVDDLTLEGSGPNSTTFTMWPYANSGTPTDPTNAMLIEVTDSSRITIRGLGLVGGGAATYTTASTCTGSVACTGIAKRAIQIYDSDVVTVEDVNCRYFHHACGFAESSRDVTFRNMVSLEDSGYRDAANQQQASFYTHVQGGSTAAATRNITFDGIEVIRSGGTGFNLRITTPDSDDASDGITVSNSRVVGAETACVQLRNQTHTVIRGIYCDATPGLVFVAGTAYRDAGGTDGSKGVLIQNTVFVNSTGVSAGNGPITIPDYVEDVTLENVTVDNTTSASNANCMTVKAPIRNFSMNGFHFRRCGTGTGGALVFDDADGWGNKPDDNVVIRNGLIEEVDRLNSDNGSSIMSGIIFSTGTMKNSVFENITIRGITNMAISAPSGVTLANNRFSHITADGVPPRYIQRIAFASIAGTLPCNAARNEYVITATGINGTDCTASGANTGDCYCNGSAWGNYSNSQTHLVNFQSAAGVDDNLFENFTLSNVDANDCMRFGGGGTNDHVSNRITDLVCYQDSDFPFFNTQQGLAFSNGVGTTNLVTGMRCPTANPSTCFNPGTTNTYVPNDHIEWTDVSTGPTDHFVYKPTTLTIPTDINCITTGSSGTVALTVEECSSAGASCGTTEAAITCDSDNQGAASGVDDYQWDAGDWINANYGATGGTVASVSVTIPVMKPLAQ